MKSVLKNTYVFDCELSTRARNVLLNNSDLFGVEPIPGHPRRLMVKDLKNGSRRDLKFTEGVGQKTYKEIMDLCTKAGIRMKD